MKNRHFLNKNWKVFLHKERKTHPAFAIPQEGVAATVPGTIHTDLFNAGIIPHPFYDMNEKDLQWIDWNDYRYECRFDLPAGMDLKQNIFLVFEGLDTIADISLNGQKLAETKNMFRSYRFKINALLKEKGNLLQIIFKSARVYGQEYRPEIEQMSSTLHPERAFVRKSQYAFGWDWGPQFATCGLWRPVYLLQAECGIKAITFDALAFLPESVKVKSEILLWGNVPKGSRLEINLQIEEKSGRQRMYRKTLKRISNENGVEFEVESPALWWPNGMGRAVLHKLEVALFDKNDQLLARDEKKVGIRQCELVTTEYGEAVFYFKINERPLFAQGVNWIPAHAFLPEIKKETYRRLLEMAAQANMNIIRVWGGGIYEDDYFYQLCDELGLLVWQDFMFACSAYPEDDDFVAEVKAEVEENVFRLRHHPSIILWNGNNENEWIWHFEHPGLVEKMPGYRLFHEWIPNWLNQFDPFRSYWPSSPWGMDADPNDTNSGNRHVWDIWSRWVDYTEVKNDQSLFVTEFGFQAPAHYQTLKKVIPQDRFLAQSESFEWHNKQVEGNERLFRFLAGHLPVVTTMADFIYLTQLNQAFALRACLGYWRLYQSRTMGAIIWQLNDCWPVTSWSLIDSELRPKLSYYQVRRIFARETVFLRQSENNIELHVLQPHEDQPHEVRVVGLTEDGKAVQELFFKEIEQFYSILPLRLPKESVRSHSVLIATLYDRAGKRIARDILNLKRWKYLNLAFQDSNLRLVAENGLWVECVNSPCFFIEIRHPDKNFLDQGFTLLPGERQQILAEEEFESVLLDEMEIFCLNRYLQ